MKINYFIYYPLISLIIQIQKSRINTLKIDETNEIKNEKEILINSSKYNNVTLNDESYKEKIKNLIKKCNSKICDERGGQCINDEICLCNDNFTTLQSTQNYKLCNYQKKNRISTAFIELFMGFGVGHFYSERKINGFLKMLFFMLLSCIVCCSIAIGHKFEREENPNNSVARFFYYVYSFTMNIIFIWQIFDFLMFILNFYRDGNDVPFT